MADGDPVSQQQFFDTMSGTKKEILDAVETVNGHVQNTRVDVGKINTKLDNHKERLDAQDEKIESQKNWNRGLAAIEGVITAALIAVGIRQQ